MRLARRAFGTGLAGAGLLAAGLGGRTSRAQDEVRRGGTLVATWGGSEPQAVYVPSGGGPSPTLSASKVFERLARRRPDGSFEGVLAEVWSPSGDFRTFTIRLRRGVRFHDGKEMTADDVVFSITELWKKHAAADMLGDLTSVRAVDAATVEMIFTAPVPAFFFASLLCGSANYVLPRHLHAGRDLLSNPANDAPVGTGPWRFQERVRGSHIAFARNDTYWREGLPYLDRLVLRYVREPDGRTAAIEAGEIQLGVSNPVPPPDIRRLAATGKFTATTRGYEEAAWATTLECNLRRKLLSKREVRQAIFHAIDRNMIAHTVYQGFARAGSGPILSPNTEYFTAGGFDLGYDPKRAATLLDGAGHPRNGKTPRFTLTLVAGGWFADNGRVGTVLKQQLEEVGISVNLVVPNRATSLKRIYTDYDFDLALSNQANPSEPVPVTTRHYTSDGIRAGIPFCNASGLASEEIDSLVARIRIETDPEQRRGLVATFQQLATREAACLPLVELETATLATARLRNHSNDAYFPASSWEDLWLAT